MHAHQPPLQSLRRTALLLVWAGLLWNLVEAGVALWSGIGANSVALLAYGLDSGIELFAGAVLVWHLTSQWKGTENEAAERKAQRLVGITFFLLVAYILVQAVGAFTGWLPQPEPSLVGIGLVVASALVMTVLYFRKTNIARRMNSPALRAEAIETLVCDVQDLGLLVGLGLNALLGWWWADPLVALGLVPFLVKEGWENIAGDDHHAPEEA